MNIHITFHAGPIEAEIEANEDDNYDDVLESLQTFIEEYDMQTPTQDETAAQSDIPSGSTESEPVADASNPVAAEAGISDDIFHRILRTGDVDDGEVEELPIILGDVEGLGDSERKQILHATTVIMAVLDKLHDVSRVKTSDLKDAIDASGLNADHFGNVRGLENEEIYITRRGSGSSATTEIRRPGIEDAYEFIRDLAAPLQEEGATS